MIQHYYILIFASLLLSACSNPQSVHLPKNGEAFQQLSEYNLFVGNLAEFHPNDNVIPFDVNAPLFSDYAQKKRFIWMPEGETAQTLKDGTINFPDGTILVKNFYYEEGDLVNNIETRLLIKSKSVWHAHPYVWNKEQTEARLDVAGPSIPITFTRNQETISFKYSVPNKNQCKNCHNANNILLPIGPKLSNLNKIYQYTSGPANQLEYWKNHQLLDIESTENLPFLPPWDDSSYSIEQRAKSYLDINCGHCHRSNGSASTSGLFLEYDIIDKVRWGICKTPVAAGRGSGGREYDIHPGEPDKSIIVYRMEESEDPAIMMPEIGRRLAHQEGIDLIRQWIREMPQSDCK